MVRTKKKTPPAKPVKDVVMDEDADDSYEEEDLHYDSMIENGTSEDSDGESDNQNEQSEDGFSEHEEPSTAAPPIKRKQNKSMDNNSVQKRHKAVENSEIFKQPTVEELNQLNETKNLFHSNLFRMQVKEILGELKVKQKYTKFVNSWIEKFTTFLMKLESEKVKLDSNKLSWLKESSVQTPLLPFKHQKNFQFQFIKPTEKPCLMGSIKQNTMFGPKLLVDVCVVMPGECFQKEDYLNLLYDHKRSLYLTYIAMKLMEANTENDELNFNFFNNNPLKPVLEITPSGSVGKRLTLRIFVRGGESTFKLNRFVPWNSNIRGTIFGEKNDEDGVLLATPHYNANVLFDLAMKRNMSALEETLLANKNIQEGLILLKVWLKQRNLNVGFAGFGSHIILAFVVYLFRQRKLHASMSSYQVTRQVWNHLALSAWDVDGKGITLCNDFSAANQPTLEQFSTSYDVVFVDFTGFYNICANLSQDVYCRVKSEAKRAVDILNNMKVNSFQLLFMTNCPVYTQFDHILKISEKPVINKVLQKHASRADRHNFAGFWFPNMLKIVTNLLRKGLSDRIFHIVPIETSSASWEITHPPERIEYNLRLGIILNPERAYETLDKGPQANDDAADEFRKFWGQKSELRRFQDGSITEACVWSASGETFAQRRLIVKRIVEHLLAHHLTLKTEDIQYLAAELDVAYKLNPLFKVEKLLTDVNKETDAEATALEVIRSFDDLGQKLRTLDGLPLDITGIQGTSSVFRYCNPVPILPDARSNKFGLISRIVNHGIIQLGLSGKWPSEVSALRALKTAFYLKIAEELEKKHKFRTLFRFDGVFVLKDGFVFHVEIAHPKEIALMKKEVNEKGITQYKDTPESVALEKRHVLLPKVASALHGLYQLHSSFGPTVMIAKRWLYSQLIDYGLWPDECTELLIASQYMKMGAQASPSTPQMGFFRFLHLLANTDWRTDMTLLNFNDEMSEESISELENRFNTERDTFPPLLIVTSYDERHYGIWSTDAPIAPVLARVTLLAKHAVSFIESKLLALSTTVKPSKLFTASKDGYDVLIRLKPNWVPNCMATEFSSTFSKWSDPDFRQFPSGQNFLKSAITELRAAFSEFCLLFNNPCGGREILVIWKPDIFTEKEFKVAAMNGCTLTGDGNKVKCNKPALIEDFKIVLKDMYLSIEELNK